MFKSLVALILAVGLVQVAGSAEKKRDWQMGKVLEQHDEAGPDMCQTKILPSCTFSVVQIEEPTIAYLVSELRTWSRRSANLTINGPVRFAVEKRTLFFTDEDGKEHKMEIVSKTLRRFITLNRPSTEALLTERLQQ